MENEILYVDNANIERSLKSKQTRLAIHGVGMVLLSLHMYILGFIYNIDDLKYWFSIVAMSYAWLEWLTIISANLFLLPRLLFLYRSYKAELLGDKKRSREYRVFWLIALVCNILIYFVIGFSMYMSKAKKPVIYLYPEVRTEVNVKLELNGKVTYSYPEYNNALGWTVTAEPDGQLTDKDGNKYPYLFWEGDIRIKPGLSKGFCVKGEDTESFLKDALRRLGLTDAEAADFISYWCPEMQQNKYNVITFQTSRYEDVSGLIVSPEPDTVIRVNMLWYASDKPVDIAPQDLDVVNPVVRKGFTVVEWGGEEYKRGLFP
ncbi:MAG: hypothetical protein SPL61_05625 [Saccharofermentans sp.]|nr:hypothetical protein [Saccharofermentans sp.]